MPNHAHMTKLTLTRRQLALQALVGAVSALLGAGLAPPAQAQVVDPMPAVPPPLPLPTLTQNVTPMAPVTQTEGELLTQIVPIAASYALSDTQAKEAAAQLKDYPGGFAKARAYTLPDDIGPAFAAIAPIRKERVK
ncbi:MAG: hypothetical protein ACRYFS_00115 [Janthinobacterium lividum]